MALVMVHAPKISNVPDDCIEKHILGNFHFFWIASCKDEHHSRPDEENND